MLFLRKYYICLDCGNYTNGSEKTQLNARDFNTLDPVFRGIILNRSRLAILSLNRLKTFTARLFYYILYIIYYMSGPAPTFSFLPPVACYNYCTLSFT